MSEHDDWQAYTNDLLKLEFEVERVIEESARRPLNPDEQKLLAWASGTHPEIRK